MLHIKVWILNPNKYLNLINGIKLTAIRLQFVNQYLFWTTTPHSRMERKKHLLLRIKL